MSRSLPISGVAASADAVDAPADADTFDATSDAPVAGALTGILEVYDPAMCCATGVCGPGVDPALLTLARDLRWLSAQGVSVQRFGLSQEPAAFVANARVTGLMQAFGDAALPAVLINGLVRWYGRYPSRDEMVQSLQEADAIDDCCAPGSGCC